MPSSSAKHEQPEGLAPGPNSVRRLGRAKLTDGESDAWSRCRDAVERHRSALMERPGVIGVEAAPRLSHGQITSDPAIRVHVYRKRPRATLSNEELMPVRIEGFPVDVVASSFRASACRAVARPSFRRWPYLQGGISIGVRGTRRLSTLGMLLLSEDNPDLVLGLTAGHSFSIGDPVVQPAGGNSNDVIGEVIIAEVSEDLDAAIIALDRSKRRVLAGVTAAGGPLKLGVLPIDDTEYKPVFMMGGCSGARVGWARRSSQPIPVDYPSGQVLMSEHIHILAEDRPVPFNQGGDSGAMLLSQDGELALGLIIAAGEVAAGEHNGPSFGLATPIDRIMRKFSLRLAI